MYLKKIKLQNFRNYKTLELDFPPGATIIAGENAQGKTNLLESIFLLTGEKSWRVQKKSELNMFGAGDAAIEASITARDRDFDLRLDFPQNGRQQNTVNAIKQKKQSDMAEYFMCVLFSPEDLYLIKDGPSARRKFMDIALCQLRPRYALALAEYNRLYDHKSKILKNYNDNPDLLAILPEFTAKMAYYGAAIIKYRANFLQKLNFHAGQIHSNVAGEGEKLKLFYKTVSGVSNAFATEKEIETELLDHAEGHYSAELACGNCLSGPHKDDIEIEINERAARIFASQGQTRTAALALKFAEREIMRDDCGEYPVMLLDDVLSELDRKRQEFLLNKTGGGQVIITCCEQSENLKRLKAKTFFISHGEIQENKEFET